MELNTRTGELHIEQVILAPLLPVSMFMALFEGYSIKSGVRNDGYSTYYVQNLENGEISISALFYNEKLYTVTIALGNKYVFPPFELTPEEREVLLIKLNSLGGGATYSWGKIALSEDFKGGRLSIGINYN